MQGEFFDQYQRLVAAGSAKVNIFSHCQDYLDNADNRSSKMDRKHMVLQKVLMVMRENPDDLMGALTCCLREEKYIPEEGAGFFHTRLHTGNFAEYIKKILFFSEAELKQQYQYHQIWLANGKQNGVVPAPEPVEPVSEPTRLRPAH
jgi:hypothetical protein